MSGRLRVGVIGASARGGWALISHVPAIRSLTGFELVAVATSNPESAGLTRQASGVQAYPDAAGHKAARQRWRNGKTAR